MRKFRLFVFIAVFFISRCAKAGDGDVPIGQYSIETDYQFGRIIAQDKRFQAPVHHFTQSFEAGFYKQTLGNKAWQRKMNYPELGASFTVVYNGDQKVFGDAYIFLMSAKFWIVRSRFVDFFVRPSVGFALAPTHYNVVTDTLNDAIGSTLNCSAALRIGVDFKPDPHVTILLGVSFTHYSNAASQFPNLGINVPAFNVGIRYFPRLRDDLKYNHDKYPKPDNNNEMSVRVSLAESEMGPVGGPKYPTYVATVNYARYTSIINKVLAGATAEFSQADYDVNEYTEKTSKYGPIGLATLFGVFVGDEIMIGRLGAYFMAGHYLFPLPTKFSPYVKIGLDYYFVDAGKKKTTKFFVGIGMKSYYFVAQYYEASAGVAFW